MCSCCFLRCRRRLSDILVTIARSLSNRLRPSRRLHRLYPWIRTRSTTKSACSKDSISLASLNSPLSSLLHHWARPARASRLPWQPQGPSTVSPLPTLQYLSPPCPPTPPLSTPPSARLHLHPQSPLRSSSSPTTPPAPRTRRWDRSGRSTRPYQRRARRRRRARPSLPLPPPVCRLQTGTHLPQPRPGRFPRLL